MTGGGGIAATVMSPEGTWSVATGKANTVRDVRVDDQFAIASVTKSVIAAQVMQMVALPCNPRTVCRAQGWRHQGSRCLLRGGL